MSSTKFRSDHDATQDRSDVIHFPEHRLWEAEARLRKAAAKAKSLEEMRALYLLRFYVVQAIVGPNAVWRDDSIDDDPGNKWNGPRLLKTPTMPFHPAAAMLPMMDKDEADALSASIKRHGLQKPIKQYTDGSILDGRNRYYACLAAGVEPLFEEWAEFDDTDPRVYVVIHNVHRRHLSVGFRARLAASLVTTAHGGDRKSDAADQEPNSALGGKPKRTREDAAKICFVSVQRVGEVTFIRNHAEPEVIAKFEADQITIGRAKMLAKESAETQREAPDVKFSGPANPSRPTRRPGRPHASGSR